MAGAPARGETPQRRSSRRVVTRPTKVAPKWPPLPPLPDCYADEIEALEKVTDFLLLKAIPARQRNALDVLAESFTARTLKSKAAGLCHDPDLTGWTLGLRLVGERLHAIGGLSLLEAVVARLAPMETTNCHLRRKLMRTAWHLIGEHLR